MPEDTEHKLPAEEKARASLYFISRDLRVVPHKPTTNLPFVFYHIPKAAGTTLDYILYTIASRCGFARRRVSGTIYGQFLGNDKDGTEAIGEIDKPEEVSKRAFISGHIPFGYPANLPSPRINATILREPISRSCSHFYFGAERNGWSADAEPAEIYSAGQLIDNPQVRQISGNTNRDEICDEVMLKTAIANIDNHFDIVGTTENFGECLQALIAVFDLPDIVYAKLNFRRRSLAQVRNNISSKFEPYNEFDMKLYEYVAAKPSPIVSRLLTRKKTSKMEARESTVLFTPSFTKIDGEESPILSYPRFLDIMAALRKSGIRLVDGVGKHELEGDNYGL